MRRLLRTRPRVLLGVGAALLVLAVTAALLLVDRSAPSDAADVASANPTTTTTRPSPTTTTSTTAPPAAQVAPVGHPVVGSGGAVAGVGGPVAPPPVPVTLSPPVSSRIATALAPEVGIHSGPGAEAIMVLPGTTTFGARTTFLVTGDAQDWYQVLLPARPNGSLGWVHESAVTITSTNYALGIDLAGRSLTLFQSGTPVLTTSVAVGRSSAPTPTGLAYITDLLSTPSPGGTYGPYAFGLSSHSDVHTEFQGGDGQVGLHGTNLPHLMGQAVSEGCVRMPNEVITQLAGMLPLGTPVQIV